MKLVATDQKVTIKWFVYAGNEKIAHNASHVGDWGYDVECSCGWVTRTGGATRGYVADEVWYHKRFDHNYAIAPYARRKHRDPLIESILNGTLTAENYKAGA
jgi:hypothetical protein